jgi:hypothetical protein
MRVFPELPESKLIKLEIERLKLLREIEKNIKKCLGTGHL